MLTGISKSKEERECPKCYTKMKHEKDNWRCMKCGIDIDDSPIFH